MAVSDRSLRISSNSPAFSNRVFRTTPRLAFLTASLILPMASFAQLDPAATPHPEAKSNASQTESAPRNSITIPAGTHIALVLSHPIQSRAIRHGDDIYAQITAPVLSGNEVAIPPGTLVQGKVDRIDRKGGRGEVHLQSLAITFPDGYVAAVNGRVDMQSDDGYALADPGRGRGVSAFLLPLAGAGAGSLIGYAASSSQKSVLSTSLPQGCGVPSPTCIVATGPTITTDNKVRNIGIGSVVGAAAGGVASIVLLTGSRHFYLDVGAPVRMVLREPLAVERGEVAAALQGPGVEVQPTAARPQPPVFPQNQSTGPAMCETPGTPGTPDIDIPGTPGVGHSPGTAAIHIAGIPATPSTWHQCP